MSCSKSLRWFFIAIIFFAAPAVMAQQVPPELTPLALEVHFYPNEPPAYQAVPRTAPNGAWYARFHRIKETGANDLPVNAVNIKSVMAPDGIHVSVSVFFGELHEKEKALLLIRCTKARRSKLRSCLGLASIRSSSRQSTSHLPHSIFRNSSVKRTRSNTSASNLMSRRFLHTELQYETFQTRTSEHSWSMC